MGGQGGDGVILMDINRVRSCALRILEVLETGDNFTPVEFQGGLTLATALYFKTTFPHDLENTSRQHTANVEAALEESIRSRFNPFSHTRIGWTTMRRIVFEAAVIGRIVRRRDYDTVGKA